MEHPLAHGRHACSAVKVEVAAVRERFQHARMTLVVGTSHGNRAQRDVRRKANKGESVTLRGANKYDFSYNQQEASDTTIYDMIKIYCSNNLTVIYLYLLDAFSRNMNQELFIGITINKLRLDGK